MFFASLFCVYGDYTTQTEGQTRKRKPHHKTQSKILPLPWLAESGTEQPGQGATFLGWPKTIYYSHWFACGYI